MATTYAYLVDPNKQYMTKSGTINVNGTLRVYDAATDDIVITYKDFNGTENEASVKLDNNGRAIVITDSARAYRLEVYDRYGSLQWTVSPLWCLAAGGGVNISRTEIISTDGSIDIDKVTVGSTTTFDIGLAPNDSDEFLEWVKCSDTDISNGTLYPTYEDGSMETYAGQGLHVGKDKFYHITCTIKVDPTGAGINYETLSANLKFNDGTDIDLVRRNYDIDNSVNDPVLCEFSYDFKAPSDGYLYMYIEGVNAFEQVDCELQVHRIYSGINAVPDSCANKPWVSEYFEEKSSMSAYIPFSGLDYNPGGNITGISGSAIYAAFDSGTVSAIASSYAESAISSISSWSGDFSSISSKIDWSSSGVFQPSGDYQTAGDYAYNSSLSSKVDQSAFEQCCDEVHSALDEKLDKSASGEFQPSGQYVYESSYSSFSSEITDNISSISSIVSAISGQTGDFVEKSSISAESAQWNEVSGMSGKVDETAMSAYVPFSGLEGEGGKVTGISGSAFKGHEYTGISPVTVDNTADTISVEHRTLCVDSTMTAYTTGDSAVIGVNVAGLDISSKMDASASSLFYPADNPSGFIDGASASAIASAYTESAASSKQDTLTFAYDDDKISSINGSALVGQGGATGDYVEKSAMEVAIGSGNDVSATSFAFGENNSASSRSFTFGSYCIASGSSIALGNSSLASSNSMGVGYSAKSTNRSLGLGIRASANMNSIAVGNSSEGGDNSLAVGNYAKAHLEAIAAGTYCYALRGYARGNNNSGTYAFMDGTSLRATSATAFGTCNLSGNNDSAIFVIGDGTDSATGRHDLMTISRDGEITMYSSTADTTGTGIMSSIRAISAAATGGVDSATVSAIASSYAESAVSSKLDASASSDFYSTSNPSGFIDSAYVDSALTDFGTIVSNSFYSTSNPSSFVTSGDLDSALNDFATIVNSNFYPTSNPSGYITGVDLTPYQEKSGMTAYQPSGDYIYVSALGWAEV